MGTWDTGIFDNDEALDFVGEMIDGLQGRLTGWFEEDEPCLEDGEGLVPPIIAIMQLLSANCGAAPPKPELISRWKTKYLEVFDEQIDELGTDEGFKGGRREVISRAFKQLETTSASFWKNGSAEVASPADSAEASAEKRRFEFVDDKSKKFWEVQLEGKSFTVTWGRIGTAGQTQIKDFANEEKATREYEKLVDEKLKKGYEEIG